MVFSSTTRFRQIVTVGGWTWASIEGNVGKLSEATKIMGERFLVDSGKLKTRLATDLLLEELKRFNTVLKTKVDDLEKILARLVAMHAASKHHFSPQHGVTLPQTVTEHLPHVALGQPR